MLAVEPPARRVHKKSRTPVNIEPIADLQGGVLLTLPEMEKLMKNLDLLEKCGTDGTIFEWLHRFNQWSRANIPGRVLAQPVKKVPSHNIPESDAKVHFFVMCYDSYRDYYRPPNPSILGALLAELAKTERELEYVELGQDERQRYFDETYMLWGQKSAFMTVQNIYEASLKEAEARKK